MCWPSAPLTSGSGRKSCRWFPGKASQVDRIIKNPKRLLGRSNMTQCRAAVVSLLPPVTAITQHVRIHFQETGNVRATPAKAYHRRYSSTAGHVLLVRSGLT